jgi:hypothetical protein
MNALRRTQLLGLGHSSVAAGEFSLVWPTLRFAALRQRVITLADTSRIELLV